MGILRIRDLNKGMALKQGDKTTLKFELYDANDDPLVLSSAGKVYFKQKGQIYAEEDVTITTENVVSFKLNTILPAGKYYIEFVVDDKVFPSQDIDTFHITSSVLGDDISVIAINGIDRVAERALVLIEDDLQAVEEAELTRAQSELDRQAQEEARESAEGEREEAESTRETNEQTRLNKDLLRDDKIAQMEADKDAVIANATVDSEVILARGGKATLGQRLDETTAQLAQKVGLGKRAELEDLSPTVLSAIEGGEGTTFNLLSIPQDNSVTERKTTFIETYNLWDEVFHRGLYYQATTESLRNDTNTHHSVVIEVEPGQTYTAMKKDGGNRFTVMVVDSLPSLGETVKPLYKYIEGSNVERNASHVVTIPEGGVFLVIHVTNSETDFPEVIVNIGTEINDETIHFKKDIEGYPKLQKTQKNLFKGDYTKAYVSFGNESYYVLSANEQHDGRTVVVSVAPNQTYSISLPDKDNDRLRVVTNADLINVSSGVNETTRADELIYDSNNDGVIHNLTFTVGENQNYLYIHVSSSGKEPRLQVELGDKVTGYEPAEFIPEKYLINPQNTDREPENYPYDLLGMFDIDNIENFDNPTNVQTEEVIDFMDNIQADFPEYISPKESEGELSNGEHIYSYTFKPHQLDSDQEIKLPKILIVGGTHGNEKNTVYSLLNAVKKMSYNWRDNLVLEALRFGVEFVVIPVFNVNGFNNNERYNLNGVDLNRNFPNGWVSGGTHGSHAASEEETQIMLQFLDKHQDADFLIDFHRVHWYGDGYVMYALAEDENVNASVNKTQHLMGRKWQRQYDYFPQNENHKFGYTANHLPGSLAKQSDIFSRGTLLEMTWEVRWQPGWSRYHNLSVLLGTELLVNVSKNLIDIL